MMLRPLLVASLFTGSWSFASHTPNRVKWPSMVQCASHMESNSDWVQGPDHGYATVDECWSRCQSAVPDFTHMSWGCRTLGEDTPYDECSCMCRRTCECLLEYTPESAYPDYVYHTYTLEDSQPATCCPDPAVGSSDKYALQLCAVPTPPFTYAVTQGQLCDDPAGADCRYTVVGERDYDSGCSGPTDYLTIKNVPQWKFVNDFAVTPADNVSFWRRNTCDVSSPTKYNSYHYDDPDACQADSTQELALAVTEGDFASGSDVYSCPVEAST